MTDPPAAATYASVVSRESVRITLTAAALSDLGLLAANIQNAYLNAPITEKIWTILGPEFGAELQGRKAIIVRALYGLKSAGAAFRNHLATCMAGLGYKSCLADLDVWMLARTCADDTTFWEYVLIYVDDILCISDNPKESLERIDKYFPMKPNSIGRPDIYLGAKLSGVRLPNQVEAWAMSPVSTSKRHARMPDNGSQRTNPNRDTRQNVLLPFPLSIVQSVISPQNSNLKRPRTSNQSLECCNGPLNLAEST
jgi:hypothetical protein